MEIHQLEYVLAVDKYRHFSKAAEEICLSQSTLSQQIRKLEEELGIQIFERNTRNVQPTPAGSEFILYAKRIMNEIERAKIAMEQYSSLGRGKIVIGAIPILGYLGISSVIARFQETYPGITLEIREAGSDILLKWIQEMEIDAALVTYLANPQFEQAFDIYPLLEDEIVLVAEQSHPLAKRKKIDLIEAQNEKFVSIKSSTPMRSLCEQACMAAGFQPKIIFESTQVETICSMVEAGLGVALLTRRVAKFANHPKLAIIRLSQPLKRTTAIVFPRQESLRPSLNAFKEFLLQHFPPASNEKSS
ncbi:LysR family transcriptional regulator [Brevibacillus fulvus]|uniref:LysR family hydrogen peroxide-inducible transcriptional activator n=1 Tax=Brevibacillus fulvus TaxID=1125967 RepID=A0A938Y096_9BACL|nr:LysR family transcriptional regulator [Brevibacillus fulvus]MBM7590945.1 LysR family hydrogen peroxide-inducible transcriptional activator [Brevibacillus fulvus]